jgi:hypothetical protein
MEEKKLVRMRAALRGCNAIFRAPSELTRKKRKEKSRTKVLCHNHVKCERCSHSSGTKAPSARHVLFSKQAPTEAKGENVKKLLRVASSRLIDKKRASTWRSPIQIEWPAFVVLDGMMNL